MTPRRTLAAALALSLGAMASITGHADARYCEGVVHGLSRNYNQATGSGFLALRAGPRAAATQIGELFNGDRVQIFARRGNWYQVEVGDTDGWASARFIRNSCGY